MSAFDSLSPQPPDPLLALIGQFNADARADKIDLGVGVYRDAQGRTPVMRAVKAAEKRLFDEQATKAYVGAEGDLGFVAAMRDLIFGKALSDRLGERVFGMQATGGTGALRLASDLIARSREDARIHVGEPTWANHLPIFAAARITAKLHRAFDARTQSVAFDEILAALEAARPGDFVLLQAACHNPTGADFSTTQWAQIAHICARRRLVPFIDVAYPGLGDGLEEDMRGLRLVVEAVPDALIAASGAKCFGLYRERTGVLFAIGESAKAATLMRSNLLAIARANYSMPPDHGAAVIRIVLQDPALRRQWAEEVDGMRGRIHEMRALFSRSGNVAGLDLAPLAKQRGMFSLLPLSSAEVTKLREAHGVYMPQSGRINVAGIRAEQLPKLFEALASRA